MTFNSHAGDLELIVPCCDSAHRFDGTQTLFADASDDASLGVRKVVRGTGDALGGTFRVAVDNEDDGARRRGRERGGARVRSARAAPRRQAQRHAAVGQQRLVGR